MAQLKVLMVAEKPSIASTLAEALCPQGSHASKRRGLSPSSPVYEYSGTMLGMQAAFRVTATTGHVYSLDFSKEYNQWEKHGPDELFHAETIRTYDGRANIPAHIQKEAQGCEILVLWLDCDREGENICFEVLDLALPEMKPPSQVYPGAYRGCVYRARFSSLAHQDLQGAMQDLAQPNQNEALSVDARQELDLRVGIAFSRLQTMYFRKHFGNQLGKQMVTYGPCQIPTLWFCVKRHVEIDAFEPQSYWHLNATFSLSGGVPLQARSDAGAIWDSTEARQLLNAARQGLGEVSAASEDPSDLNVSTEVTSLRSWSSVSRRPRPLNTVEMLKMGSDVLGLGPDESLHCAEQLYLKGILSYPRTETDRYPENFDLEGTVRVMTSASLPWAEEAQQLLGSGLSKPREDGVDVGDHPPITPVKAATCSQCGGEANYALYEEVCRHFLASLCPDASFREADASFQVGSVTFSSHSSRMTSPGWTRVARRQFTDEGLVDLSSLQQGMEVEVQRIALSHHLTSPPRYLTESGLLELMDKHGIGTDASMASHVGNVQKRKYVDLDESTRQMRPSALGLALCHAYMLIDPEIVLPTVRASIENACARIAAGEADKSSVVLQSIRTFQSKFCGFARQIDRLPLMLAVAYSQGRGG
ncbi:unnamed protein product, partial [Polarella glacialis]